MKSISKILILLMACGMFLSSQTRTKRDYSKRKLNKKAKSSAKITRVRVKTVVQNSTKQIGAQETSTTCDLAARVMPLLYWGRTNTIELKLAFRSSCLDFPLLFYFVLPWNKDQELYLHAHPTFVTLMIFGRQFNFKFLNPFERGRFPDLNVAYKDVRIFPSNVSNIINVFEDNNILLTPSKGSSNFNIIEINKLLMVDNPLTCNLIDNKKIMLCNIA